MKLIAFDLEIAKEVEGEDWEAQRPLGITCAAICGEDLIATTITGGKGLREYAPTMTSMQVRGMVSGFTMREDTFFITWNGLGFDWYTVAEECFDIQGWALGAAKRAVADVKELALNRHIDPGFQMLCEKGFMVGLDTAAKGLGLPGKTEGMSGDKAPAMWKQGIEAQAKVLEYVGQDAVTTMQVYQELLKQGELVWITGRGTPAKYPWKPTIKDGRLLTVAECLELPLPDTSWMDDPWPRSKFTAWMEEL